MQLLRRALTALYAPFSSSECPLRDPPPLGLEDPSPPPQGFGGVSVLDPALLRFAGSTAFKNFISIFFTMFLALV
jgi:hypothetical protein